MEVVEVATKNIKCGKASLSFKKIILGFNERNHLESDIIPEIYCYRNKVYISNDSYFVITGRFMANPEYKTIDDKKLIDVKKIIDTNLMRAYTYKNEFRKRFINDIKSLIKKARLEVIKTL